MRELSLGERMKMELIAALLHSPEVLFLDEPTIGLDVVAQHNIQKFLKHYQQVRGITILLTSHYMKDVAALCQRVVIIAGGRIVYDGSLDGIIDQFSNYKVVTLEFADERMPGDLSRFGDVLEVAPPRAKLEVDRSQIAAVLSTRARQLRDSGRERRGPAAGGGDRELVRADREAGRDDGRRGASARRRWRPTAAQGGRRSEKASTARIR